MINTLAQILHEARQQLKIKQLPREYADFLIAKILQCPRSYLITHPEISLTQNQLERFANELQELQQGKPLAYILGDAPFLDFTVKVNENTLIPRPETELLVQYILHHYQQEQLTVADLGTGCGVIALALARARPHWHIIASDKSKLALQVAKANANALHVQHIDWRMGAWCQVFDTDECMQVIVANPPYISYNDPHVSDTVRQYEPASSLFAHDNGLADLQTIISQARTFLKGELILEHGFLQADALRQFFSQANYEHITTHTDFQNHPRFTSGFYESSSWM